MSRSNGTQVHLRQVSLASEATYKCEVSADSPTFATVSAERQMKVYGELRHFSARGRKWPTLKSSIRLRD